MWLWRAWSELTCLLILAVDGVLNFATNNPLGFFRLLNINWRADLLTNSFNLPSFSAPPLFTAILLPRLLWSPLLGCRLEGCLFGLITSLNWLLGLLRLMRCRLVTLPYRLPSLDIKTG